ncbi:MAG: M20/M25/M40 family metallo-hydrolase [Chloroflexota bacterium]|nr:M20/M25/M40 family metallo-hydrolase [Chloroflexota bacterium]
MTVAGDTTELIQQLIRNACVNDGTPDSGHETRSVETLAAFLQHPGVELRRYEPHPGRGSLVLRIEGREPHAPSLHLMGHLDVVPVNAEGWQRDPFAGELVDGEVWGRGAIDMLAVTASMAVSIRELLRAGFRPRGTLVYSAMADEEALGTYGAAWLTENAWDDVRTDHLLTEFGGARLPLPGGDGPLLPVSSGEKGSHWLQLRVRGRPGHGSMPYRTDNALTKAAEAVSRIGSYRPPVELHDLWQRSVTALGLPASLARDPAALDAALADLPLGLARMVHAGTRTTFTPTVIRGGTKTNVIPDNVEILVDVRTLPGHERDEVHEMLADALGDLREVVEITGEGDNVATASPLDTSLWDTLTGVTRRLVPGATPVPFMLVGATDARFFRRKGVVAYGYGLYSARIPFNEFVAMFHGNDERVDVASLELMTQLWEGIAREFVG